LLSRRTLGLALLVVCFRVRADSQSIDHIERERAQIMLQEAASDVRRYYYDPKLRGVDLDAKVRDAKEKIAKAESSAELLLQIAAVMETLGDSHTAFVPPHDPIRPDYGWRFQMVGEHCFVTHVRPKSDADAKGVKPGDEVLTIDGFTPTRESLSKMEYVLAVLLPQSKLRVSLRDPSGKIREVDVMAKVRQAKTITNFDDVTGRDAWRLRLEHENQQRLVRPLYKELNNQAAILKLSIFSPSDDAWQMIEKARGHECLVVDLRGNPGGAEPALQDLLGRIFETDVKIADRVMREATNPMMAKGTQHSFSGKLILLVDSRSASAAELFARVIQIEKRGIVLGDRTAGSVMEARYYPHTTGTNPVFTYGTSVAIADLTMQDGKSLEHTGVAPDETILPTAADLANGRDPVLARAAVLAGATLSSEEAGKLFPYEWPMN